MALQKDTLNLADLEAKYGIAASMLIADTSLQEDRKSTRLNSSH